MSVAAPPLNLKIFDKFDKVNKNSFKSLKYIKNKIHTGITCKSIPKTPVASYEAQISKIKEVCEDPWFSKCLSEFRDGNFQGGQMICGRCLKLVFDMAKKEFQKDRG